MRQTSLLAYAERMRDLEGLGDQQRLVFSVVSRGPGSCCDRMIAQRTGLPINVVTPRRGELVEKGLLVEDVVAKDPLSNRLVTFWKLKETRGGLRDE